MGFEEYFGLGILQPMIEEDEQLSFGLAIGEEQTDAQAASGVVNTCHQDLLEPNKATLQEIGRLEEHRVSSQMSGDILEMVVHPSLGRPIDEVRANAQIAGRAARHSESNPLNEYIDRACSIA